jgi:hypothetical protein
VTSRSDDKPSRGYLCHYKKVRKVKSHNVRTICLDANIFVLLNTFITFAVHIEVITYSWTTHSLSAPTIWTGLNLALRSYPCTHVISWCLLLVHETVPLMRSTIWPVHTACDNSNMRTNTQSRLLRRAMKETYEHNIIREDRQESAEHKPWSVFARYHWHRGFGSRSKHKRLRFFCVCVVLCR